MESSYGKKIHDQFWKRLNISSQHQQQKCEIKNRVFKKFKMTFT